MRLAFPARLRACLTILLLPGVFTSPAAAADSKGNFSVKGAGAAPCSIYLDAATKKDQRFFMFAGWMEGMLSGINVYQADTFDMVPWQSTDLLALAAAAACTRDPKASFHTAVLSVSRSLYNGRLRERSDRVVLGKAPQQVALYAAVIAQAQARLVALKLLKEKPTGKMSSATTAALKAFQKSKKLPETGLPDQITLYRLLVN